MDWPFRRRFVVNLGNEEIVSEVPIVPPLGPNGEFADDATLLKFVLDNFQELPRAELEKFFREFVRIYGSKRASEFVIPSMLTPIYEPVPASKYIMPEFQIVNMTYDPGPPKQISMAGDIPYQRYEASPNFNGPKRIDDIPERGHAVYHVPSRTWITANSGQDDVLKYLSESWGEHSSYENVAVGRITNLTYDPTGERLRF